MTLASRIGVMDQGKIVQVGEPHEVYEYPRNRFVADFLGDVNIFEGRLVDDATDHAGVHCPDAGTDLRIHHSVPGDIGTALWVAVRPEKIQIARKAPRQEHNVLKGVVEDIAYTGGLSHYRILLPTGRRIRVTRTNRDRHERPITWDEEVYAYWGRTSGIALTS